LVFGNKTIAPKQSVKILGVTLDSGLSMNEHVSKVVSKAIGKCMALRKIRGVRPAQMRQMYIAAVVPTTDYAASTWYAPSRIGVKRHVVALERVQRLGARLILRAFKSVAMLVLQSEAKLQSVSERLHERVSNHMAKLCSLAPDHPLQRCISWFPLQGSAFPSPLRAVYEKYETQLEPEKGLRIRDRPSWVMPPWQTLKESVLYLKPDEAVQLCRSLRFRGAYLYYAAAETGGEQIGAAATIKYRMTTGTVKQQAVAETKTCSLISAELTAILYALEHARDTLRKTAHVYVATKSKEALSAIAKGHKVGCGREVVHKIADAVLEMESVGHKVTVFLVPCDKGIRGVAEAKQAARHIIENGSELTTAPAERVRELSGVLRLVKAERAKGLHTSEDDVCVKYYTWKMDKAWSGKHTLSLYGALSSDEASILVQARTEHCGLNACLFRKKLAGSPACECGRGDETVLHVLLRCDMYAEARKALREAAGDRWGDASYLLGGWSGRKDVLTGKFVDGPRESWKPDLKVVRASIRFLYQTGRLSRSSDMRVE
jgi:ribonuclease HI